MPFCPHPERVAGCGWCDRYYDDPVYRDLVRTAKALHAAGRGAVLLTGTPSTTLPAKVELPLVKPKCPFEGRVMEACTADSCAAREIGHLRDCTHPDADWTRCTRGPSKAEHVQSCADCGLRPVTS